MLDQEQSTTGLQLFSFEGQDVRAVWINKEAWYVLTDVCKILGLGNPTRVTDRLDQDGVTQSKVIDSLGREQEMLCVNLPNYLRAIMRSDKPDALKFQNWICKEVVPAILKTGSYSINQEDHLKSQLGTIQFFGKVFTLLFKAISVREIVENKPLALGALSMLKHVRLLVHRAVKDYETLVRYFHGDAYSKHVSGDVAQFKIVMHNGELVVQLQFPFIEEAK